MARKKKRNARKAPIAVAAGMQGRPQLSAALIVRNAADRIEKCLSSLQPVCDEIIVVNTGATDDTPRIAQSMGAKIVPFRWQHDYGLARSFSLSKCKGRFIIWLDPDETLAPEGYEEIRQFVKEGQYDIGTMGTVINSTYKPVEREFPGYGAGSILVKPRLLRNRKGLKFVFRVHEDIYMPPDQQGRVSGIDLKTALIYNWGDSTGDNSDYYTALLVIEHRENPKSAHAAMYLGERALGNGHPIEALKVLGNADPQTLHSNNQKEKYWMCVGRAQKALAARARNEGNEKGLVESLERAAGAFKQAYALTKDPLPLMETSFLLLEYGQPDQGMSVLKQTAKEYPTYEMAQLALRVLDGVPPRAQMMRIQSMLGAINTGKDPLAMEQEIINASAGIDLEEAVATADGAMPLPVLLGGAV